MKGPAWFGVPPRTKPVGYAQLIERYQLQVAPRLRLSFVADRATRRTDVRDGRTLAILPPQYDPGSELGAQLEFALKHEGIDLEVLALLFSAGDAGTWDGYLGRWIASRPTGQYSRKIWFLYEFLTRRRLPIEDAKMGNYVRLLDPEDYFTADEVRSRRHRVIDNLLGNADFCPMVRRTKTLADLDVEALRKRATDLVASYDEDARQRAVGYLYTKETRTSFELEGERPDATRSSRFMAMLKDVDKMANLDETELIRLQNGIVLDHGRDAGYRSVANYIGETVDYTRQIIHYIAPRAEDVHALMRGWRACLQRMAEAAVTPLVQAACISFGFVFIHPFTDGNGRIHRLLIHWILSQAGFTPQPFIFPISATMLKRKPEYDAALESFSKPLMQLIDYEELEDGRIEIRNDTATYYRFVDYTRFAEDLGRWMEETVDVELKNELDFIVRYRAARQGIEAVADLPDRERNNFIQMVLRNQGKLSANKRALFSRLSDDQVAAMEEAVQEAFKLSS